MGCPPDDSPISQRVRRDQKYSTAAGSPLSSPPPRTESPLLSCTAANGATQDRFDADLSSPFEFLERLSHPPPAPTGLLRDTYRADYDSLPLDFQVLANPYMADMATASLVASTRSESTGTGASAPTPLSPQRVESHSFHRDPIDQDYHAFGG